MFKSFIDLDAVPFLRSARKTYKGKKLSSFFTDNWRACYRRGTTTSNTIDFHDQHVSIPEELHLGTSLQRIWESLSILKSIQISLDSDHHRNRLLSIEYDGVEKHTFFLFKMGFGEMGITLRSIYSGLNKEMPNFRKFFTFLCVNPLYCDGFKLLIPNYY